MAWQTIGDHGEVTCDTPGCEAFMTAGTVAGACFDAAVAGWDLWDGRTRRDNRATCPACLLAQDEALGVVPTAAPWLDGPEQDKDEAAPPVPTQQQQQHAYDRWGAPWLADYED